MVMQLSEKYRRAILLPSDAESVDDIRKYSLTETTKVEMVSFEDSDKFYRIWQSGLFKEINAKCGTLIDDYEECLLEPDELRIACEVVQNHAKVTRDSKVKDFCHELSQLLNVADARQFPVIFVL